MIKYKIIEIVRNIMRNLYKTTMLFIFTLQVSIYADVPKSLTLSIADTTLNRDHNTTITLKATYDDNRTKTPNNIEWLITPKDAVEIKGDTLTALKDTNVTIQAKVGNTLSNKVKLTIYWEVDGHRLPPEPDPKVNNATLGGVDSNHNGVRDDVERKIYERYPVKLQRELMMDGAKYFQKIMAEPISKARALKKEGTRITNCELYLMDYDSEVNSDNFDRITFLENNTVNTKQRVRKYLDYNLALSGGVYGSSPYDWNKDACSQRVREALEEMGL